VRAVVLSYCFGEAMVEEKDFVGRKNTFILSQTGRGGRRGGKEPGGVDHANIPKGLTEVSNRIFI